MQAQDDEDKGVGQHTAKLPYRLHEDTWSFFVQGNYMPHTMHDSHSRKVFKGGEMRVHIKPLDGKYYGTEVGYFDEKGENIL